MVLKFSQPLCCHGKSSFQKVPVEIEVDPIEETTIVVVVPVGGERGRGHNNNGGKGCGGYNGSREGCQGYNGYNNQYQSNQKHSQSYFQQSMQQFMPQPHSAPSSGYFEMDHIDSYTNQFCRDNSDHGLSVSIMVMIDHS